MLTKIMMWVSIAAWNSELKTAYPGCNENKILVTNGNKLVEVLWEGRAVMMFTQDLRARGEKIN